MTGFTDNAKTWDVCGIKLTLKWFTWTANIIAEPADWLCYELHVWRIVVRFSTWVRNSALLQIVQANLGAHLAYNSMDDKRTFSPGLLRLQRKADHPSQPTADVTNAWSYTFTLPPPVFTTWTRATFTNITVHVLYLTDFCIDLYNGCNSYYNLHVNCVSDSVNTAQPPKRQTSMVIILIITK